MASDLIPKLNSNQYLILIGAVISGISAIFNSYDAISGIDTKQSECEESNDLKKSMTVRFGVLLALASLAIIGGVIAMVLLKEKHQMLTLGLISGGLLAMVYVIVDRYLRRGSSITKLGLSWVALFGFVFAAFFFGKSNDTTSES